MNYTAAKDFILQKLEQGLSKELLYHGLHHTLDVLKVTQELCIAQGVSAYETQLVKTAALYHDSGFIINNVNHEELGCGIVRAHLPTFGYELEEVERICAMIMATRIPQSPQHPLEEILCDADLDYLGRDDFYRIGNTLFQELKILGVLQHEEEWNRIQVTFLESHAFFTTTNQERRTPRKMQHLTSLRSLVASY